MEPAPGWIYGRAVTSPLTRPRDTAALSMHESRHRKCVGITQHRGIRLPLRPEPASYRRIFVTCSVLRTFAVQITGNPEEILGADPAYLE